MAQQPGRGRTSQDVPALSTEVTDDAEQVRIATAVGDAGTGRARLFRLPSERANKNPGVLSCQAAVAHCRGIWNRSGHHLRLAASLYNDGKRPLAYASALGGPWEGTHWNTETTPVP